jgi:hypothetical protein
MSENPEVEVDQLKERIAQSREELGETVEALAAKADVKARASGAVHDAVESAKAKVHRLAGSARGTVDGAKDKAVGAKDRVVDAKDKVAEVSTRPWGRPGAHTERALVVVEDGSARMDRRLHAALLATAVGAVLGAVIVWVNGRRRS